ncbi:hypothetical protein [Halorubrum sp. SY-15]|uniref:hypothetical protein n=1 Tax=Halorubrum sp. SY-15 TaxID=3402277 RepID=UPI003EB704D6
MTNLEAGGGCDECLQGEIRLEIKETRQGKILTYADNAAPSGLRGMTEMEIQAHGHITDLISRFNTESVEPGYVGSMYFDDSGQPDIEWNREDARAAAENSI